MLLAEHEGTAALIERFAVARHDRGARIFGSSDRWFPRIARIALAASRTRSFV